MRNSLSVIALGFAISIEAFADAPSWASAGKVNLLASGDTGGFHFSTEIHKSLASNCDGGMGYVFNDNGAGTNRGYSLLMAAYLSGKPINVYLTGQCSALGRPLVSNVEFSDTGSF